MGRNRGLAISYYVSHFNCSTFTLVGAAIPRHLRTLCDAHLPLTGFRRKHSLSHSIDDPAQSPLIGASPPVLGECKVSQ